MKTKIQSLFTRAVFMLVFSTLSSAKRRAVAWRRRNGPDGLGFLKTFMVILALFSLAPTAHAQGTAFTYQGQLQNNGALASGTYNLTFTLFATSTGGTAVAGPATNTAVFVTNGLFTVLIDFGASVWNGQTNWLEIGVETNGGGSITTLSPRQLVTPAPYAIYAEGASNLLGTLPVAQLRGTIPASQLPAAVVTNNQTGLNLGGAFNGNFSGNGGGLTNVSGAVSWQIVSGATQQAQPNTGYLLTNNSLVTVTLPPSPKAGDVVRVCGGGASDWKLAQNASQFVYSANLAGNIGAVWVPHGIPGTAYYSSVASSADGTKLAAVAYGGTGGGVYVSSDSGVTWLQANALLLLAIASSADGTKYLATDGEYLYTSSDSGSSWQTRIMAPTGAWLCVASSADGTKLAAGLYGGQIYTSTNSGTNWTARASTQDWYSVASSADGTRLVAVVDGGQIYTSTDSGTNWTARASSQGWYSVASSADGTRLVAVVEEDGQIYTSSDSGVSWTAQNSGSREWYSVASSSDGSKLVAVVYNGLIYTSVPSSVSSTTSGTAGYLLGNPNAAIELLYLGNNQFLPISHEGIIQAF